MQEACQARLAETGYAQYEVSAYAQPGHRCRHNLNYWQFGDYLGIGAGAHGKISGPGSRDRGPAEVPCEHVVHRRWKLRSPIVYMQNAHAPQRLGGNETVIADQLPFEFMLNALRLNGGVPIADFTARTGLPVEAIAAPLREAHVRGWLVDESDRLQATSLGRRLLNDFIEVFLPPRNPERRHA
jgi:oxygen-independent coproporphyrinogen-3 oxidase